MFVRASERQNVNLAAATC